MKTICIGSRGSRLALLQSMQIRDHLSNLHPENNFEVKVIKTTGDRILDAPLSKIGDKGLFTKEIENELLSGSVDMAVHSMKDMPTALPGGLVIGAVTARLDPRDVFISRNGKRIIDLKKGDVVATGSLRRKSQLLAFRPGLEIIDIRGNVESRLRKMRGDTRIEGTILANAGLMRLGMLEVMTEIIPESTILPAVGQGSLAIEVREDDPHIAQMIGSLDDRDARIAVSCERSFLSGLGGGCQVPIAGYAAVEGHRITLTGLVGSLDGGLILRESASGETDSWEEIGARVAGNLLRIGADKILDEIYDRRM